MYALCVVSTIRSLASIIFVTSTVVLQLIKHRLSISRFENALIVRLFTSEGQRVWGVYAFLGTEQIEGQVVVSIHFSTVLCAYLRAYVL